MFSSRSSKKKHIEVQKLQLYALLAQDFSKITHSIQGSLQLSPSTIEVVCSRLQEAYNLCINPSLKLKGQPDFTASDPYGCARLLG